MNTNNPINDETLRQFKQQYWPQTKHYLRLGQAFLNFFDIGHPWPELFYCENQGKSEAMIREYLENLQYDWYKVL